MDRSHSNSRKTGTTRPGVLSAGSAARRPKRSAPGPGSRAPTRYVTGSGSRASVRSLPAPGSKPPGRPKRRLGSKWARWALLLAGLMVLTLVLLIVIDSGLYNNKIHAGITISGQNVGGLTRDEAAALLTHVANAAEDQAITLTSGENTWKVMPVDVGTTIDIQGSVDTAMQVTRQSSFLVDFGRRLKLYSSTVDVPLRGTVDGNLMDVVLNDVAQKLDLPAVDAGLAVDSNGTITMVEARSGLVVDKEALREQLAELLFTLHATKLAVPMVVQQAQVQAEDETAALEQAQTLLGGPVELIYKDKSWTLTAQQLSSYLGFKSEMVNGVSTVTPYILADKLAPFFTSIADKVGTKPVDATFDSDGNQAWVVPGKNGEALDPEKTAEAIMAAMLKTTRRTAEVVLMTAEPDRTTAEAAAMGIKDKLAGFTTAWDGGGWDRAANVKLATELVTDVLVRPGDVYDFEKEIGPRTEERGFHLAKGITGPGKLEDVLGGGICQVSTTLFNAAFFAGLAIVERHNHSIYIDHYPLGRDATVTTGADMRFKNDTANWILIRGSSNGIKTTFSIYGTSDGREVSQTTSDWYDVTPTVVVSATNTSLAWMKMNVAFEGQKGGRIVVERTVTWPNGDSTKDKFYSYWDMIPRQIEWGYGPPAKSSH